MSKAHLTETLAPFLFFLLLLKRINQMESKWKCPFFLFRLFLFTICSIGHSENPSSYELPLGWLSSVGFHLANATRIPWEFHNKSVGCFFFDLRSTWSFYVPRASRLERCAALLLRFFEFPLEWLVFLDLSLDLPSWYITMNWQTLRV